MHENILGSGGQKKRVCARQIREDKEGKEGEILEGIYIEASLNQYSQICVRTELAA